MLRNMIKIIFRLLIMVAAWNGFRDMMFIPQRGIIWILGQMVFAFSLLGFMGAELLSRNRFTLKTIFNSSTLALAAVPVEIGVLIWGTEEPGWIVAWAFIGLIFLMLVYLIRLQWLVEGYKALRTIQTYHGRRAIYEQQGVLRETQTGERDENEGVFPKSE